MRDLNAVLTPRRASLSPAVPLRPTVTYDDFQQLAWKASQQIEEREPQRRGAIPIWRLRRALPYLPQPSFNQHLLRLERNGLVYLIPPGDPEALRDDERRDCLPHPNGDLRSFVLWLSPRSPTATVWD